MTEGPGSSADWIQSAVHRFERPLTQYALRLVGDAERARDVVQDTFLRLCTSPKAEIEDRLAAWLFTVCRNRALDALRKDSRMAPLALEKLEQKTTSEPLASEVIEHHQTRAGVIEMLESLPANQKEVLRLKFQHGLSYREISEVTGLSESNVGYLIHHGLRAIRAKLGALAGTRR
jgi:RNA polymerase sigma-70 factor (ECF subfamily)